MNAQAMPSDAEALAFLKRYAGAIRYGIHLERVPHHDRNDVLQDIAMHVVQVFRRRPEREHCVSFAVNVARQRARGHMARKRRAIPPGEQVDPDQLQLEVNERLQAHELLHACVQLLPVMRREVMQLRLQGLTHREVAFKLNLTLQGAKLLAHRATKDLRRMLKSPPYR